MERMAIADITVDADIQPRGEFIPELAEQYAERMRAGDEFPPVDVFCDGESNWLADGFHRVAAAADAELDDLAVTKHAGGKRQAIWHSFGANTKHGQRRGRGDAKRAVERILKDHEWRRLPQAEIAKHVGVSPAYVSQVKASIKNLIDRPATRTVRRGDQEYEQNTANIGRFKPTKRVIDEETGQELEVEVTPERPAEPERMRVVKRGVGIERAHEAIGILRSIPANDPTLPEAITIVRNWIATNFG